MLLDGLQLAGCALAIGYAGARLTHLADALGEKTGMSGSWVGLWLLAAVTSLPELATGLGAVTAAGAPDIAVGDVLGSVVFNLVLLVMLDMLHRPGSIYQHAGPGHVLSAAYGVIMLGVVGASVLLERDRVLPGIGSVGGSTPLLLLLYLLALRSVFAYERREADAHPRPTATPRHAALALGPAATQFALCAAVVVVAGAWLPIVGGRIAQAMGWTQSFVGTLLVAGATSMPEIVVTLAALRLRALDMAIGGLLGSNLFDLLIIGIDDLFYRRGSLLADVSAVHAVTAFSAVMMSGAVIVGLVYRPRQRVLRAMSVVSAALLAMYLMNVLVLWMHQG